MFERYPSLDTWPMTLQKENNMKGYSWEGTVPKPKQIQFFPIFYPQWGWQGQWSSVEWAMIGLRSPSPLPSFLSPSNPHPDHPPSFIRLLHSIFSPTAPPKKEKKKEKKGIMLKKLLFAQTGVQMFPILLCILKWKLRGICWHCWLANVNIYQVGRPARPCLGGDDKLMPWSFRSCSDHWL